ncbi:MAG: pyridoxal-phosphate dependent enzyme [Granulosicoccus sp.]|nr:pyridoxal-phosphate dependent enzyme [Granulosicoccus sp.]
MKLEQLTDEQTASAESLLAQNCPAAYREETSLYERRRPNAYSNILETIGHTPVVKINQLAPAGTNMFVKVEAFNPLGSVKDRVALGIIETAERQGLLTPGQTIIEATSGNTGIGLAMVCAQKGYPLVVVMAENFSIERRRLMRYLGAKVILTPATRMGSGMLAKAEALAAEHGWFLCRQFANEANADIHSDTTAAEILRDFPDGILDYFVSGYGTGGTLKGVASVLRSESPSTRIVAAEPDKAPMLSSGVQQDFNEKGDALGSHSVFKPHPVQGWAPDFLSKLTHDAVSGNLLDDVIPVSGTDSLYYARQLARKEGIFCGISGGATFAAARQLALQAPAGSNILCMLPDTGERYLSTPLFDDIASDMSAEELAISASTEGCQFSRSVKTKKPKSTPPVEVISTKATQYLKSIVQGAEPSVVIFSLEWCEFCWSVEKLFQKMNVEFQTVHIESPEHAEHGTAEEIQNALAALVSSSTIPQVFVAGEYLGGCTQTFKAFLNGSLQTTLSEHGISFNETLKLDPSSLLPAWTHPR